MEANNMKAVRKALVQVELFLSRVERHRHPTLNPGDRCDACKGTEELRALVCAALAKPPRNCDVGTAEEQYERYCDFTGRYNPCAYEGYVRCSKDCPICRKLTQEGHGELLCQLEWAQMPYEEGGEKCPEAPTR